MRCRDVKHGVECLVSKSWGVLQTAIILILVRFLPAADRQIRYSFGMDSASCS
jgi:hypothetical protein